MSSPPEPRFGRILLKLSGEALMGSRQYGIDPEVTREMAVQIAEAKDGGVEIAIVVGGGNFFRGAEPVRYSASRRSALSRRHHTLR